MAFYSSSLGLKKAIIHGYCLVLIQELSVSDWFVIIAYWILYCFIALEHSLVMGLI